MDNIAMNLNSLLTLEIRLSLKHKKGWWPCLACPLCGNQLPLQEEPVISGYCPSLLSVFWLLDCISIHLTDTAMVVTPGGGSTDLGRAAQGGFRGGSRPEEV